MEKWYSHAMPLVGKKCYEAYHGRRERCKPCPSRRSLETGEAAYEVVPKREAGGEVVGWVDLYSFPFIDQETGQMKGVIEYVRDITERKRYEEAVRESEERLKILFEFAPDAYYLNDLKGKFIDGNKAAEEITGYKREELIGMSFLKSKLISLKQIPKAAALLVKNALGQSTGPDEFILNRKDGTQVPVEIRSFPVKIKDQALVLAIARDISERKQT